VIRIHPTTTRALNERLRGATEDVCICACDVDCTVLQDAVAERARLNVHFAGPSIDCVLRRGTPNDYRRARTVRVLCGKCLYVTHDVIRTVGALDERLAPCAALVEMQLEAKRQLGAKSLWVPRLWCDAECPQTPCEELKRMAG